jgi:hypothetical protein
LYTSAATSRCDTAPALVDAGSSPRVGIVARAERVDLDDGSAESFHAQTPRCFDVGRDR